MSKICIDLLGIESLKHEIQSIVDHSKRPHIVRGFGNALELGIGYGWALCLLRL